MANVTGSSNSLSALQVAPDTILINTMLFVIASLAIILNTTEIHLIRKKWKKATDFEVLLLNLGIADFLSAIGFVLRASLGFTADIKKKQKTGVFYSFISIGILTFFCIVSTKLVTVIAIERLLAIKLPLKHRLWHISRKTMYKRIIAVWVVSLIVICLAFLSDYFIQNSKSQSVMVSLPLAYTLAAYLSLGACIIIVTYSWLQGAIFKRSEKSLNFDKKDYKMSPSTCRKAFRKEKATIIVCSLVSATFLTCNIPTIVALYRGKLNGASVILLCLNSVMNPLIYFFKGYVEKRYSKKKLAVNSNDSPSPKPNKSDSSSKSDNPSAESNGKLKQNDQQPGGSKDKGQISQMKSDSPLKMAGMSEEKHGDISKSNGYESGSSRSKGERSINKIDSSFEIEKVDKVENVDMSTIYGKGSESSKVNGDEILNAIDPKENNQQLESVKDRGEEQDESLSNKANLSIKMDTVNFDENDDSYVEDHQKSRSSKDKGADQGEIPKNKPNSFVGVETVKLSGNDDLCKVNCQYLEGSYVKGESFACTPDTAVKLNSVADTLNDTTLKTDMAKITNGHEDTHL
eukprot:Seg1936.7 transcript_id=Seg1936.7/GoldUCD/mRNA.D3Y31 product="Mas-related G-protein coupled receptor member A8" protein_id=Seg1936.7/GoldUCD/D3Y31